MWAIVCGEKENFLNSCSIALLCDNSLLEFEKLSKSELLQSEAIMQEVKKLSFSPQTIAHTNQHILQKYVIQTKQVYDLLDGVCSSYIIRPK